MTSTDPELHAHLRELLLRCARNDLEALAELYDRTSERVYVLCRCLLDTPAAEAATLASYREVWSTADHFDEERFSASAWILAIAHRIARAHATVA